MCLEPVLYLLKIRIKISRCSVVLATEEMEEEAFAELDAP
jgi:hypothetical protein